MSNFISLAQAISMTSLFRSEKENILALPFRDRDILPLCETFDRISFEKLLASPDCQFIRIYFGMGEDMKVRLIAVGADAQNNDILPADAAASKATTLDDPGPIVEDGIRCPPNCPPPSPLNP